MSGGGVGRFFFGSGECRWNQIVLDRTLNCPPGHTRTDGVREFANTSAAFVTKSAAGAPLPGRMR